MNRKRSSKKTAAEAEANVVEDASHPRSGKRILVLHGPNLNLLGTREPQHYGAQTLADIDAALIEQGVAMGIEVLCFQSNAEHLLVERVHAAAEDNIGFIVINPAAFTHTSVALRDALAAVSVPFIEVHLSNVHARESFRHTSYFSDKAVGVISGLGAMGYLFALGYALHALED
jgi:3-dehydroquinate dehydratase-2